jgi:hypothetical protein
MCRTTWDVLLYAVELLELGQILQANQLQLLRLTFRCSVHRRFLRRYLLQPSPSMAVQPTACRSRQDASAVELISSNPVIH